MKRMQLQRTIVSPAASMRCAPNPPLFLYKKLTNLYHFLQKKTNLQHFVPNKNASIFFTTNPPIGTNFYQKKLHPFSYHKISQSVPIFTKKKPICTIFFITERFWFLLVKMGVLW